MSVRSKFSAIQEIRSWTLDDVVHILEKNGMLGCCEAFKKRDVDGENLLALTEGKLALWKRDLTLTDIRKLATFVQDLNDSPEKYVEQSNSSCNADDLRMALKLRSRATMGGSESPLSDSGSWDTDFDDEVEDTNPLMPTVVRESKTEPTVTANDDLSERPAVKPPIAVRPPILGQKPLPPQRLSELPEPPSAHDHQVMNMINVLNLPPEFLTDDQQFYEDFYESIDNTNLPSKAEIAVLMNRSMVQEHGFQATTPARASNAESPPDLLKDGTFSHGWQSNRSTSVPYAQGLNKAHIASLSNLQTSQAPNRGSQDASSPASQAPDQDTRSGNVDPTTQQTFLKDELNQLPPLRKITLPSIPSGRPNFHSPLVGVAPKLEQLGLQVNKSQLFRHLDTRPPPAVPGSQRKEPPPVPNSPKPTHHKPPLAAPGQPYLGGSSQPFRQLPPLPGQNNLPESRFPSSALPPQQANLFQTSRVPPQIPRNSAPLMAEPEEQYESVDGVAATQNNGYDSDEYESIKDNTRMDSQEAYLRPVGSLGEPPTLPAKPGRTKPPEAFLPSTRPPSPPRKKPDGSPTWNLKLRNFKKNKTNPAEYQKDKSPVLELKKDFASVFEQKSATLESRSAVVSQRPLPPTPQSEPVRSSTLPPRKSSRDLMHQPWYRSIDRQKAEELLMGGEDGSFVVRPSSQTRNPLTLSLLFNRNMYHISVRQRPDGKFALGLEKLEEQCFSSIEELIVNYQSEKLVVYRDGKKAGATLLKSSPK